MARIKNKVIITICTILLAGFLAEIACAQNIETNSVTGKTYVFYIVTPFDFLNSEVMFGNAGSLSIMMLKGYGFYTSVSELFAGYYLALNARMSLMEDPEDIFLLLTGITVDPFISGTGFMLVDYTQTVPLLFTGFEKPEEGM